MDTSKETEVLILSDGEGNYFAIPTATVEQFRVPAERQGEIEQALGDDVTGYGGAKAMASGAMANTSGAAAQARTTGAAHAGHAAARRFTALTVRSMAAVSNAKLS